MNTVALQVAEPETAFFSPIECGGLIARLAESDADIDAAQALRYRVFYAEGGAIPSVQNIVRQRDFDAFDAACDHVLVISEERSDLPGGVVGTYRLLRRSVADRHDGFYTAGEYDISPLLRIEGEILELGRSCVEYDYRNRAAVQLLWQAIAAYVSLYDIRLMFGCASLPGDDPEELSEALAYLYHYHLAPEPLRPRAIASRHVEMAMLPHNVLEGKKVLKTLPPLIKGYLRVGGFVGDGAVIDPQFNTVDVSVIVKTDLITGKYSRHYGRSTQPVLAR
jgi:putative hemolysin